MVAEPALRVRVGDDPWFLVCVEQDCVRGFRADTVDVEELLSRRVCLVLEKRGYGFEVGALCVAVSRRGYVFCECVAVYFLDGVWCERDLCPQVVQCLLGVGPLRVLCEDASEVDLVPLFLF